MSRGGHQEEEGRACAGSRDRERGSGPRADAPPGAPRRGMGTVQAAWTTPVEFVGLRWHRACVFPVGTLAFMLLSAPPLALCPLPAPTITLEIHISQVRSGS